MRPCVSFLLIIPINNKINKKYLLVGIFTIQFIIIHLRIYFSAGELYINLSKDIPFSNKHVHYCLVTHTVYWNNPFYILMFFKILVLYKENNENIGFSGMTLLNSIYNSLSIYTKNESKQK